MKKRNGSMKKKIVYLMYNKFKKKWPDLDLEKMLIHNEKDVVKFIHSEYLKIEDRLNK